MKTKTTLKEHLESFSFSFREACVTIGIYAIALSIFVLIGLFFCSLALFGILPTALVTCCIVAPIVFFVRKHNQKVIMKAEAERKERREAARFASSVNQEKVVYTPEEFAKLPAWKRVQLKEQEKQEAAARNHSLN